MTPPVRRASYLAVLLSVSGCGAPPGGLAGSTVAASEPPGARPSTTVGAAAPGVEGAAPTAAAAVRGPAGNEAPSSQSSARASREVPIWRSAGTVAQLPLAAGRFVSVPLPEGPEIVSVSGRGAQDVWLLNDTNDVYRHDGRTTRLAYSALCLDGPLEPESVDLYRRRMRYIAPLQGSALAIGYSPGANEILGVVARLGPRGAAHCTSASGEPQVFAHAATAAWLVTSASFCFIRDLRILAGPSAPVPALSPRCSTTPVSTPILRLWMNSPRDVWAAGPRIWQYQGLGWQDRGPAPFEVLALWADEGGTGWIIGKPESQPPTAPVFGSSPFDEASEDHSVGAAPAVGVARFDGRRWRPLAVPQGFTATRVHGTAADDVWFVGGPRAYHFDGQTLRQTAMPLDGVWDIRAVGGDLWVVGYVSQPWSRKVPGKPRLALTGDKRGAAVRLVQPTEEGQR